MKRRIERVASFFVHRRRCIALPLLMFLICSSPHADAFRTVVSRPTTRQQLHGGLAAAVAVDEATKNSQMLPIEKRIASAGRRGRTNDALDLFRSVPAPHIRQVNAAIDACARARPVRVQTAFDILEEHAPRVRPNVYTFGALMNAVSRAGRVETAVELLDTMQSQYGVAPNAVVYQSAVTAASNAARPDVALQLLRRAKAHQVPLTVVGYNAALSALKQDWTQAARLLEQMCTDATIPDPDAVSYGTVMAACEQCGAWDQVLYFADRMQDYSSSSSNTTNSAAKTLMLDGMAITSALHACQQLGLAEQAISYLELFKRLRQAQPEPPRRLTQGRQRSDVRQPLRGPDAVAYRLAISACARGKAWQDGIAVLDEYCAAVDVSNSKYGGNDGSCGSNGHTMAYTAAISGCEYAGEWKQAFSLLRRMRATNIEPNEVTFAAVIGACATACANMKQYQHHNIKHKNSMPEPLIKALGLLNAIRKDPSVTVQPNIQVYNAAIRACAEGHDLDRAFELVDELKDEGLEPNVISYGTLMTACERVGSMSGLSSVFNMMRADELEPNEIIYGAALSCCRKAKAPERAFLLLRKMIRDGLQPNIATFNTVLVAQTEGKTVSAKDIERAILTFQSATAAATAGVEPNRQTYSLLIRGLAANQRPRDAEAMLRRMRRNEIMPDVDLYTCTVTAYERIGQPLNALRLMEAMREDGYDFYEVPVLNSAFKKAVRLVNVVAGKSSSSSSTPVVQGEFDVEELRLLGNETESRLLGNETELPF